jgi:4-alpha-glucanotransferase
LTQFSNELYADFLNSKAGKQWQKIGVKRRAGVLAPLFSLHSHSSLGIGEIPDLCLLAEWCKKTNMSIIQLLPMNDTGFNFTPYDCQSTFACDPMYLSLEKIQGIDTYDHTKEIEKVKAKFPAGGKRVNYKIKKEKIKILWSMFESIDKLPEEYEDYVDKNSYWICDYAFYKVLKDLNGEKAWEQWEEKYRFKEDGAMAQLEKMEFERMNFYMWLQWQLSLQFKEAKAYANSRGVLVQGDLPFLVSRDSADVWAHQNYFKLNLSSGAPPDMYFAKGQRWGMPPYNWARIEEHGYDYLVQKVKYAENFYDMFRIDHFVGLFRLWTIKLDEPHETYGLNGKFDPEDEDLWKDHGQKILKKMAEATVMLPCAEDLGVVPAASFETLKEFSIPGMDVQRWARDWGNTYNFRKEEEYRKYSVAVISSHDMSPLCLWWQEECGTVDAMYIKKVCEEHDYDLNHVMQKLFDPSRSSDKHLRWLPHINTPDMVLRELNMSRADAWMFYDAQKETFDERQKFWTYLGLPGAPDAKATREFVSAAIRKANNSRSIFSIQSMQDWLSLGSYFEKWDCRDTRVNVPGTMTDKNWSIVMPLSLEELLQAKVNDIIKNINIEAGRV